MSLLFDTIADLFRGVGYVSPKKRQNNYPELVKELSEFFDENDVKLKGLSEFSETLEYIEFELLPDRSQSVKAIRDLLPDLCEWMGDDAITIEVPLSGSRGVGIIIPKNTDANREEVNGLVDILSSEEFAKQSGDFLFPVGNDMQGEPVYADLAAMPHLLVAGSTGSGKSVFVDTMLVSFLCQYEPEEFRLVLADTKSGMNFAAYEGIPHLLKPVVTDCQEFFDTLRELEEEITRRYRLMSEIRVRNLTEYNSAMRVDATRLLPRILVIVDDIADMIEKAEEQTKERIIRITQMARASGVHLCVVTQSPNKKVLPPDMTYNLMGRAALAVTNIRESRIVLEEAGAEKLRGRGDLLFTMPGYIKPLHVQGLYISKEEIDEIAARLKKN